jgi:hypothetical protein
VKLVASTRGTGSKAVALGAALVLCATIVSGCSGYEAETTTVTTTVTEGATGAEGASGGGSGGVAAPEGPRGTMGIRVFGPVQLGMTEDRVRDEFGEPDRVRDVNFGVGEAPQTNWIWDLGDGTVALKFDNSSGTLVGWTTDSPQIESVAGVSVGESIKPVLEQFSEQVIEDPQGTGALVLSQDAPGTSPALTFALVQGGNEIVQITGGALVQPAGD